MPPSERKVFFMVKTQYSSYCSEVMIEMTELFYTNIIKSNNSRKIYRYLINGLCDNAKKSIEQCEAADVASYFLYQRNVKHNNDSTLSNKYAKLVSYFRFLDSLAEKYKRHPDHFSILLRDVKLQLDGVSIKTSNVATVGDIQHLMTFLADTHDLPLYLAVELSVRYGMTSSRIVALRKCDLVQNRDYYCIMPLRHPGNGLSKDIALCEDTVLRFIELCHDISDTDPVFRSRKGGGALSQRRLQQLLMNACLSAEIPSLTFNALRNACISFLRAEGATANDIERMTGSPAAMIFRYNDHAAKIADTALRYHGIPLSNTHF